MKATAYPLAAPKPPLWPRVFAAVFGAFLGVALLKFGSPPIMEKYNIPPANAWEFFLNTPWPIAWAYWALGVVAFLGLLAARWEVNAPRWVLALPLLWLIWQVLATARAVDALPAHATLAHFAACAVCFYLGCFSLSRVRSLVAFWLGLLAGLVLVTAVGWEQHLGGLEETRRYFYLYIYPTLPEVPPEYLKKLSSNRIFSTLFYPNALAGALLLLLPVMLGLIWRARARFTPAARWFLALLAAIPALACLYWSGSKGGWLLMLLLGLLALTRLPLSRRLKTALVAVILLAGLAGFFWEHAAFLQKGATSVSARFDYWQAAVKTTAAHPVFGTGPGTFSIPYQRIKRPESEMTRLVHNDYLEQATDSGLPGFAAYLVFIVAALVLTSRKTWTQSPTDWLAFSVWLGLVGWAAQGLMEFGLYIPALAWPAFAFLGLLLGRKEGLGSE